MTGLGGVGREARWAAILLALPVMLVAIGNGDLFAFYQVKTQDMPVLLWLPVLFLVISVWSPDLPLPDRMPRERTMLAFGIAMILLLGFGTYRIMADFPLSRDEHMVVFDMAVFGKGRLAAPLAPEWRDYASALVPAFLLNEDHPVGLVSAYLPMNAVLRLLFSQIADPAFFNPVLAFVGGVALFDIARRLFGEDMRARWVVLLVYALSTQMLVAAMTTYAMTAHMALNLVWLAAFLRGGKAGHAVAIAIAFLAIGLHQLVFHPLFAAPFLLWRLRQGEWRIVLLYGAAYLAILGWWSNYAQIASVATGISAHGQHQNEKFFAGRILPLLLNRDPNTFTQMMLNLIRFVAWQNLALLPLILAALPLGWRGRTLAGPLLWGIGSLILLVGFLLPYQGHGWGYRYLHPFLGSFALLAGFGYQRLVPRIGGRADGIVILLSALTLVVSMPILMVRAHGFVAPHVALEHLIARQTTNFVLIDTEPLPSLDNRWAASAIDNVRNRPDLDNPTLRFASRAIDVAKIRELCRRGSIAVITRTDMLAIGFAPNRDVNSPRFARLINAIAGQPCLRLTRAEG